MGDRRGRFHGRNGLYGRYGHDGRDGQRPARSPASSSSSSISSIKSIQSIPIPIPPSTPRPTYPEIAANAALVLIGVACALLDRQITAQAAAFTADGGFTERLYRVRTERRDSGG